jgi:hypothetical protein
MYFRRKTSAGRFEELQASGQLERLVRSGARFAAKALVLSAMHQTREVVHHAVYGVVAVCTGTVGYIRQGYARAVECFGREQASPTQANYTEELTREQVAHIYQLAEERSSSRRSRVQRLKGVQRQASTFISALVH